jgi:dienelactone hydrolase
VTSIKASSLTELQGYLLSHKADVGEFKLRGPFAVAVRENQELRLSASERVNTDWFLAAPAGKAPLAIFLHGHDSSKEAHAYQAQHLASWGIHSLTLQLPNNGPWSTNGRTLARVVELVHRQPAAIDGRIDVSRIILVGHSFGASAAAVALAEGAPAAGAVMLDPAAIGRDLPKLLDRIKVPVMVLGADEHVTATRNRGYFFRFMRAGVAELSIRDATHEDAQYPSEHSLQYVGGDSTVTEASQIAFVSALTAAALSLSSTGKFDYAWASFGEAFDKGQFFNPRRK